MIAVENGDIPLVEMLLETSEGTVNDKDVHNLTPLMRAATDGNAELVRLLLEHGADPNVKGPDLWTPLHFAANEGKLGAEPIRYIQSS